MIGWLVIGTAKYFDIGVKCLQSIKENYKGEHDSKYFLFTEKASELSSDQDWITTIDIDHIPFPYISIVCLLMWVTKFLVNAPLFYIPVIT